MSDTAIDAAPTFGARQPSSGLVGTPELRAPMSFGQEALWFLCRLAPSTLAYHLCGAARVLGPVDPAALGRAFQALARRHPALRATFGEGADGTPEQRIAPVAAAAVPFAHRTFEREADLNAALEIELSAPFDLERGPLLRAGLLSAGDVTVLWLAAHHLIADFWSLALLLRDLGTSYAGSGAELATSERTGALDVASWARWQRQRTAGPEGERELAFWRRELAGELPRLELPTDRPLGPARNFDAGAVDVRIAPEATRALGRLARSRKGTLFVALLAGYGALLSRLADQDEVVIGAPTTGRLLPGGSNGGGGEVVDLSPLVGYFVNPVAVRARLTEDPEFGDLIERLRPVVTRALEHQAYPFSRLAEEIQPEREAGRSPIFDAVLAFEKARGGEGLAGFALGLAGTRVDLGGLDLLSLRVEPRGTPFHLALVIAEVDGGLSGSLRYASDLFERTTAERFAAAFARLLEAAAAKPETRLSALPLLGASEVAELLAIAPGPGLTAEDSALRSAAAALDIPAAGPIDRALDELVARAAERAPRALALEDGERRLEFGALMALADDLAARLRALGVREESRVAVCLPRSAELVIAELGALRAGGAFVPIDPAHPEERRAHMVAAAAARAVVTSAELAGAWCGGAPVIRIESGSEAVAGSEAGASPPAPIGPARRSTFDPDQLAYVIFTSGSTGVPKGVEISHRAALQVVTWCLRRFGWRADDRGLLAAGPGFDATVIEIWPCLAAGASLHLPGAEVRLEPEALVPWLAERGVSIAFLSTPLAEATFAAYGPGGARWPPDLRLRTLLTGGDRLHRGAPEGAPFALWNLYGPTENAVVTTGGAVAREVENPSIGAAIDGSLAYVVDRFGNLMPAGAPGELAAGGLGLARGYAGDPAQTADRFRPDPFSGVPGGRLYRTGDRVRWRQGEPGGSGGGFDYLGRVDQQVKIRGQRIEIGEIEAALAAQEGVREAAVGLRQAGPGERRLVAYVVLAERVGAQTAGGEVERSTSLAAALARRLPEAMVPQRFFFLERLPLTPNGKVDRRALTLLAPGGPGDDGGPARAARGAGRTPRTPTEERLAALWEGLLDLRQPGIDDDFFALGGHSLLAVRLIGQIRRTWGVAPPLAELFATPTIAALARAIDAAHGDGEPPVRRRSPEEAAAGLPLSFAQEQIWLREQLEPGTATYHIAGGLRLRGHLSRPALAASLAAVRARHSVLRARFVATAAGPQQRIVAEARAAALPTVDLAGLFSPRGAEELDRAARVLSRRPFDLASEPPLRLALFVAAQGATAGTAEATLIAVLHHLAADGWSLPILLGEIAAGYGAALAGVPAPLPELKVQAPDCAAAEREALAADRVDDLLDRWWEILAGWPVVLDLPSDRPRPPIADAAGDRVPVAVEARVGQGVADLARRTGGTPFSVLLAAWSTLLAGWIDEASAATVETTRLLVATPIANRERSETANLIGCFASLLPVPVDLRSDPSFAELVERTRDAVRAASALARAPFDRLVEAFARERDLGRPPLVQAALSLVDSWSGLRLPGLEVEPVELRTETSKLEVTLELAAEGQRFAGAIEFAARPFSRAAIERLARRFERLLGAAVAAPERPLSALLAEVGIVRRAVAGLPARVHAPHGRIVDEAIAIEREDRGRGRHQIVFAVPAPGASPSELARRLAASRTLFERDSGAPVAFAVLPSLPRTSQGEVDLAALSASPRPAPAWIEPGAPRGELEELIAAAWREVLPDGTDASPGIDRGDDFFALGGNPPRAARLGARLRRLFGCDLDLADLIAAPTLAELAARVESAVAGAADGGPLAAAETATWTLERREPGTAAENVARRVKVAWPEADGARSGWRAAGWPTAGWAALARLATVDERLRTTFPSSSGRPLRQVAEAAAVEVLPALDRRSRTAGARLPAVDLRGLAAATGPEREAERVGLRLAARPFDLEHEPPLFAAQLALAAADHLLLVGHRIAFDEPGLDDLIDDLAQLFRGGKVEIRASPSDRALREAAVVASPAGERALAWWRGRLAGAPEAIDLPADRPRPGAPSRRVHRVRRPLPPPLSAALDARLRTSGASRGAAVVAAWAALLARLGGGRDLVLGVGLRGLRGRWPLRFDLESSRGASSGGGRDGLGALLTRAVEAIAGVLAHTAVPAERIAEDGSATPSQVLAELIPTPAPFGLGAGAAIESEAIPSGAGRFDLALAALEGRGSRSLVELRLDLALDLFDPATGLRLLSGVEALLAGLASAPERSFLDVDLLAPAERHQLTVEWSDHDALPRPSLVHDLVARHARERPDAPALLFELGEGPEGRLYRYRDLEIAARTIARRLAALGAGPDRIVGVSFERGVDRILAMIGIWMAGACYLPVDPELPVERRALLLADARAVALVARESAWRELLDHGSAHGRSEPPCAVLLLDDRGRPTSDGPEVEPLRPDPDNLAYVIYTSGSTGTPKGVGISHRHAAAHFAACYDVYRMAPTGERIIQFAAASFDVSMEQVGTALVAGGALVVRGAELPNPATFSRYLGERGITMANLPTAFWTEWTWAEEPPPPCLKVIISGGEAMTPAAAERFRLRCGGLERPPMMLNGYGPTETVVTATAIDILAPGPLPDSGSVSIGRPLPMRSARIVDARGDLQPLGGRGELVLGGLIGRGYLGRPDLTAERFRPDPWGGEPGARVYWTGDLVRFRGDGAIDYLGRVDQQIKIRGFRIEPGEIEAALAEHPEVREALVLARDTPPIGKRLIAWFRPRGAAIPDAMELRRFLGGRLPEYMVPSAFVALAEWPIGATGKIDRRALPPPPPPGGPRRAAGGAAGEVADRPAPSPATAAGGEIDGLRREVAGIVSELLGIPHVRPDDDFFALGGHSLLATRAVVRLRERFGVELPVRRLFETPTVEGIARAVEEARATKARGPGGSGVEGGPGAGPPDVAAGSGAAPVPSTEAPPPLVARARPPAVPLSFAQERLWFLDRLEPGSVAYNLAAGLRLRGASGERTGVDLPALGAAFTAVFARHEALRTRYEADAAGRPRQVVEPVARVALPVADLAALPRERRAPESARLRVGEARRPFDLVRGPVARALIATLDGPPTEPAEVEVGFTFHHIATDGWSLGIFLHDLAAFYGPYARRAGSSRPPLPPLPVQYADYALWQRGWLSGEHLERQLAWWRGALARSPGVLELPYDHPRPVVPRRPARVVRTRWSPETSDRLLAFARGEGASLFMALVAAVSSLLNRLTEQERFALGTPVANRPTREAEGLIGFFVNTLVLPVEVDGAAGFRALVARVREVWLGAYAHQDVPLERLVEELAPRRDLAADPLFQVLLALQNAPLALALPGLEVEPIGADNATAKLDLAFLFKEDRAGFEVGLEIDLERFDESTGRRWLGALERLVAGALADPAMDIADLPVLSEVERREVLALGVGAEGGAGEPGQVLTPDGRPRAGFRLVVLDRRGRPTLLGAIGALHATAGEERDFRATGRLARLRPDGRFEDRGAADRRVEIDGLHVALDAVEALLGSLAGVRAAAVDLRPVGGGLRPVAWVEGEAADLDPGELAAALRQRLPDLAVPAAWSVVEALPRTLTGEVDRRALPTPAIPDGGAPARPRTPPATPIQQVVADLWRELLGADDVAAEDSFFELGGHSLLAVQLASRIGSTFQVELPLKKLFEAPTIVGVEEAIRAAETRPGQSEKIARALLRLRNLSPEAREALRRGSGRS